jgi:hypothetical protein
MARRGIGVAAIGIGAFMGLGIAMNMGDGSGAAAYVLALAFCTVLPIGAGVALLRGNPQRRQLAARAEHAATAELLRLAEQRGGSLTVAEVMAQLDLSKAEAEGGLERLCQQGLADYRVSHEGVVVYHIGALLTRDDKQRAEGVLDA